VDPYLRPIFDALNDMLPGDQLQKRLAAGEIEVAPIAFMRGRTLAHAFVVLDEAQNTTPVQMKMFLTRLGEGSRMVVTGDLTQIDLPTGTRSGLTDALNAVGGLDGVAVVQLSDKDVVRHALVARIVRAYEARERTARRGGS
ncbi:MAG TPA: PhoH family protein, partial [Stellaceae bacterium]|nr:PhoH family protein [Stellaceae bacterium]